MTEPIITVQGLRSAYDDNLVLQDVSFRVFPGEIFGILGGSGSGKSTLLKHMIGLHKPLAGSVSIEGEDIVTAEGRDRMRILRKFGVMYQHGALFGSMTLFENVRLPLEEFTSLPAPAMDLIALMKLDQVGLRESADYMPAQLSGGMQKRAAIARAMALDPRILFLDEPSAGLDPITSASLDQLILRIARGLGITFVVVTHELPSIYAIADRVIVLDRSTRSIIGEGHPGALRETADNPRVRGFFRRLPEDALESTGAQKSS